MGKHEAKRTKKKDKSITRKKISKMIFVICIIIFVCAGIYIGYNFIITSRDKKDIKTIQEYMDIVPTKVDEQVEKIREMQKNNKDIKAWIKIDDTKIDYPVVQGEDNEYYLTHSYKNEKNKYGSIFLKSQSIINNSNSNLILYGHNMKDGEMFGQLLNYAKKDYYEKHKTITFVTDEEVREYKIFAAFKSRVFYKKEKNVFRFYDGINFENEEEYNSYIENVKKIQLYDTGTTAEFGEQLLTMITCEYSQKNGRMVVVAKRIK